MTMNDANGKRVDVLAVMEGLIQLQNMSGVGVHGAEEARAAVAKLIEADIAFNEAFHAWQANTSDPKLLDAFCAADDVLEAALNRIRGEK